MNDLSHNNYDACEALVSLIMIARYFPHMIKPDGVSLAKSDLACLVSLCEKGSVYRSFYDLADFTLVEKVLYLYEKFSEFYELALLGTENLLIYRSTMSEVMHTFTSFAKDKLGRVSNGSVDDLNTAVTTTSLLLQIGSDTEISVLLLQQVCIEQELGSMAWLVVIYSGQRSSYLVVVDKENPDPGVASSSRSSSFSQLVSILTKHLEESTPVSAMYCASMVCLVRDNTSTLPVGVPTSATVVEPSCKDAVDDYIISLSDLLKSFKQQESKSRIFVLRDQILGIREHLVQRHNQTHHPAEEPKVRSVEDNEEVAIQQEQADKLEEEEEEEEEEESSREAPSEGDGHTCSSNHLHISSHGIGTTSSNGGSTVQENALQSLDIRRTNNTTAGDSATSPPFVITPGTFDAYSSNAVCVKEEEEEEEEEDPHRHSLVEQLLFGEGGGEHEIEDEHAASFPVSEMPSPKMGEGEMNSSSSSSREDRNAVTSNAAPTAAANHFVDDMISPNPAPADIDSFVGKAQQNPSAGDTVSSGSLPLPENRIHPLSKSVVAELLQSQTHHPLSTRSTPCQATTLPSSARSSAAAVDRQNCNSTAGVGEDENIEAYAFRAYQIIKDRVVGDYLQSAADLSESIALPEAGRGDIEEEEEEEEVQQSRGADHSEGIPATAVSPARASVKEEAAVVSSPYYVGSACMNTIDGGSDPYFANASSGAEQVISEAKLGVNDGDTQFKQPFSPSSPSLPLAASPLRLSNNTSRSLVNRSPLLQDPAVIEQKEEEEEEERWKKEEEDTVFANRLLAARTMIEYGLAVEVSTKNRRRLKIGKKALEMIFSTFHDDSRRNNETKDERVDVGCGSQNGMSDIEIRHSGNAFTHHVNGDNIAHTDNRSSVGHGVSSFSISVSPFASPPKKGYPPAASAGSRSKKGRRPDNGHNNSSTARNYSKGMNRDVAAAVIDQSEASPSRRQTKRSPRPVSPVIDNQLPPPPSSVTATTTAATTAATSEAPEAAATAAAATASNSSSLLAAAAEGMHARARALALSAGKSRGTSTSAKSTLSNYAQVKNALSSVCLAGSVLDGKRVEVVELLDFFRHGKPLNNDKHSILYHEDWSLLQELRGGGRHFIIMFSQAKTISFKGVYIGVSSYANNDNNSSYMNYVKIYGKGPKEINGANPVGLQKYLKFETAAKQFKDLHVKGVTSTVDAIVLDPIKLKVKVGNIL